MKKLVGVIALAAASASMGWFSATLAGEKGLPDAVRQAVEKAYPQAKLGKSGKVEVERTLYEVVVQDAGTTLELTLAGDGTLVRIEQKVPQAELPAAVAATLTKQASDGAVKEIDRCERRAQLQLVTLAEPKVTFEATVMKGSRAVEIHIGADGAVLADDDDDDDDGEDDDDDDDGEDDDDDDDHEGKGKR